MTVLVRDQRRAWLGLAALALPTLLLSVDVSVLYLALPQISAQLGADATQQLWILDIYSFLLGGFLVTMGTLGDRIGRRRLLLIGAAAFGVASVLAAYAPTPELLIAARALLGVAGPSSSGRLDLVSVGLSLAAILPTVYGLKESARHGFSTASVVAMVVGVACGWLFVERQRTLTEPLLDLNLFRNRVISAGLGSMLAAGVVMAAVSLLSAQYLQVNLGLSPLAAGLWLIPQNVAMVVGSLLAPVLAKRFPQPVVMAAGLLIAAAGLLLHVFVGGSDGHAPLVAGLSVASFGVALPMALLMNVVMAAAPPEKAGSAASLSETGGEFGIAVGIATLGSLAGLVYRSDLTGSAPDTLPATAVDAAGAGVVSAHAVATQLPADVGAALFDAARSAFASGIQVVAVIGAALYAALALVTLMVLRHGPPDR